MSNNNLPERVINVVEQAGVSTNGWVFKFVPVLNQPNCEWIELSLSEDVIFQIQLDSWSDRVYILNIDEENVDIRTSGLIESIQLADRLKRAILGEPDRVAELEELIRRFYVASSAMLTGISIANHRQGANIKGEVVDNFNKVVNEAKAALAKARGGQS